MDTPQSLKKIFSSFDSESERIYNGLKKDGRKKEEEEEEGKFFSKRTISLIEEKKEINYSSLKKNASLFSLLKERKQDKERTLLLFSTLRLNEETFLNHSQDLQMVKKETKKERIILLLG